MSKHFYNQTPIYEENYRKVLRLIPSLASIPTGEHLHQAISSQLEIIVEIVEQSPYTTQIKLIFSPTNIQPWPIAYSFLIRVCHDARVAEVIHYQDAKRIAPNYQYPNAAMFHPDEKHQINRHLAETLDLCLNQTRHTNNEINA